MGTEDQGAKPNGFVGRLIGMAMNVVHTRVYRRRLDENLPAEGSTIVDIGCGGGRVLKHLADMRRKYRIIGIDHSAEMVKLARQVNRHVGDASIANVEVLHASVTELPLPNDSADVVMGLETVQFWPDIKQSFAEVRRILKRDGVFLLMNRYPKEGSKWWNLSKIKSAEEYRMKLESTGFAEVTIDLNYRRGWIVVTAGAGS